MHYLTLEDFQIICTVLTDFFKKVKDPPPNYQHSYFDKVDSVISIPQKTFDSRDLYPTLFEKAACYLYFINKLHPFNNGNKRISIVATGVFLRYNKYELDVSEEMLYQFAKAVTQDHQEQKKEFGIVVSFIQKHSKKTDGRRFPDLLSWIQYIFRNATINNFTPLRKNRKKREINGS